MQRAVSTILIPFLLASQGLFSVAHSHAGTSLVDHDGPQARPHVHLHGVAHHHGHDAAKSRKDSHRGSTSMPIGDGPGHDSDAVYTGEKLLLNNSKVAEISDGGTSFASVDSYISTTTAGFGVCPRHPSPPVLRLSCSLYLQNLSILC